MRHTIAPAYPCSELFYTLELAPDTVLINARALAPQTRRVFASTPHVWSFHFRKVPDLNLPRSTPTVMSLSLDPRCPACGKRDNLLRCQACKVVSYCCSDHQVYDRINHKVACDLIKKAQKELDTQERELRAHPGDFATPANPFETAVGHFWGILDTRPYSK